jgi:hypothetical protein
MGQGLTIAPLLSMLKLSQRAPKLKEYELTQGKVLLEAAAFAELDSLWQRGMITDETREHFHRHLSKLRAALQQQLVRMSGTDRAFEQQQERLLHRHLIATKKSRLMQLSRQGLISDTAFNELNEQLDEDLAQSQIMPPLPNDKASS